MKYGSNKRFQSFMKKHSAGSNYNNSTKEKYNSNEANAYKEFLRRHVEKKTKEQQQINNNYINKSKIKQQQQQKLIKQPSSSSITVVPVDTILCIHEDNEDNDDDLLSVVTLPLSIACSQQEMTHNNMKRPTMTIKRRSSSNTITTETTCS